MCGNTNRPTLGGMIAVLLPPGPHSSSSSSETSRASSPDSISSVSSSYSLFFRDQTRTTTDNHKTRAILRCDDPDTYHNLRSGENLDICIEKYGDLSETVNTPPLHHFKLDLTTKQYIQNPHRMEMEFELPARLDLSVSEKGVVGRQVTMREAGGAILGVGIVGYN